MARDRKRTAHLRTARKNKSRKMNRQKNNGIKDIGNCGDICKRFCMNCHRCNMDIDGNVCEGVHIEMRDHIVILKATALIKFPELCGTTDRYMLCDECDELIRHKMLCCDGIKKSVPWRIAWPSFLWHSFELHNNLDKAEKIWKLLSLKWRLSWLESVRQIGGTFSNLESETGGILFDDISSEYMWFKNGVDSLEKIKLESCVNKHCVPRIRCPWGCTEFIEKCGFISFGILLYHLNPIDFIVRENYFSFDCGFGGISRKNCLNGLRPDYLTYKDNVLGNPEWKIQPSIVVTKETGATFCTCSKHSNGSPFYYIHPPINPLTRNETASQSNNLAPAVLVPRTFKNMKINNYNDSYSMVKLNTGYHGMDCCSISLNRRFDKGNILSLENEMLSVHGRTDIKEKLSSLVRNRDMSRHDEDVILKEIENRDLDNDMRLLRKNIGSNCINIKEAFELCEAIKEEEDQASNGYIFPWPGRLIKCDTEMLWFR